MSEKLAILTFWDSSISETVDLRVTWSKGYDKDARIRIPKRYKVLWDSAIKDILWDSDAGLNNEQPVSPYPALPWSVKLEKLKKSATGFFAILDNAFGADPNANVSWRVWPPYPMNEDALGVPSSGRKEEVNE